MGYQRRVHGDDNEMKISLIEKQWLLKKPAKSIFLVLPSFFIFCNKRLSLFRLKRSTRRSCKTAIRLYVEIKGFLYTVNVLVRMERLQKKNYEKKLINVFI